MANTVGCQEFFSYLFKPGVCGFSKPSVSRAIGLLRDEGLVKVDKDGYLKLTEAGQILSKRIYERHTVLSQLFMRLGVDEAVASEDACRMEHYISEKSFRAVKTFLEKQDGTEK